MICSLSDLETRSLLLTSFSCYVQLPLPKWVMWRWRGPTTTELPLSVGPHSPSVRQEGFPCTLWRINPLCKLGKWCVPSAPSAPLRLGCRLMTLTQQPNTLSLWMLAQREAKYEALLQQVSACCLNVWVARVGHAYCMWVSTDEFVLLKSLRCWCLNGWWGWSL